MIWVIRFWCIKKRVFKHTLSLRIMVQWKKAVLERYNYYLGDPSIFHWTMIMGGRVTHLHPWNRSTQSLLSKEEIHVDPTRCTYTTQQCLATCWELHERLHWCRDGWNESCGCPVEVCRLQRSAVGLSWMSRARVLRQAGRVVCWCGKWGLVEVYIMMWWLVFFFLFLLLLLLLLLRNSIHTWNDWYIHDKLSMKDEQITPIVLPLASSVVPRMICCP